MKAVADTGPINYLIWIGHVSLLPALFGTVSVPEAVCRELEQAEAPLAVRQWIASPPDWLAVCPTDLVWERGLERLGGGERGAIGLATAVGADLIVMDDRLAVAAARLRSFTVTGTLGVLEAGARRGMVDLADAFDDLRRTSFRVRADLLTDILARHELDRRE